MVKKDVHRFEIWLVQLDPIQGYEIKKKRPCVVVSPDEMATLRTVIVAPMTSKGFSYPTRIQYTFQGKKGLILLDQLRTVDKSRLIQRVGLISQNSQIEITNCLQELFAY